MHFRFNILDQNGLSVCTGFFNSIAYNGSRYVAVGKLYGDDGKYFFTSEDGETFNEMDNLTDNTTPESELASRQIAQTVNKAIEDLPEDLRTAIVLREIEGMSYEDIAQSMNCPIGTVRSRIFRAREAIATKLRPMMANSGDRRW